MQLSRRIHRSSARAILGILTFIGLTCSGTALAAPAPSTDYWYQTGSDSQWTTLAGNWWTDANHTSQASNLPTSSDNTILLGPVAPTIDLAAITQPHSIDSTGLTGSAQTSGFLVMRASGFHILNVQTTGNATFFGTSYNGGLNGGTITGNATFNDGGSNYSGTINGTSTFNDNSTNYGGTINGNAVFNNTSNNTGTVNGNATFVGDLSTNSGGSSANLIRLYTSDATTTRDFTPQNGTPWTVTANGAHVNVSGATFDGSTVFQAQNNGCFIGGPSPVCAVIPSLTTDAASSVMATGAILSGAITDNGNASSTVRGFAYGLTTAYGATTTETGTFDIGAFASTTVGLLPNTPYHFRAYATNVAGTGYGADQTFTTISESVPVPAVNSGSSSGGSVSSAALASILAPSASATAYLKSRSVPAVVGCPAGYVCTPQAMPEAPKPVIMPTPVAPVIFSRDLSLGSVGSDVKALQQYLNAHGSIVAASGTGSAGHENTAFGPATKAALIRFQKAHGIPATGFFGPKTRVYIQAHR